MYQHMPYQAQMAMGRCNTKRAAKRDREYQVALRAALREHGFTRYYRLVERAAKDALVQSCEHAGDFRQYVRWATMADTLEAELYRVRCAVGVMAPYDQWQQKETTR